jgi:hypothetical protein
MIHGITSVGPFRHGQSISLLGEESKGSVGVFLSPDGLARPWNLCFDCLSCIAVQKRQRVPCYYS